LFVQWPPLVHSTATVDNDLVMDVTAAADAAARPAPRRLPARLLRLLGDERLVDHVRAGSAAAFEVLYDRHHRGVLAFCRHMLGSVEEAEDAVQHTFMAAYRELVSSHKAIRLRPWLFAIARNRCLSVLRRRREQALEETAEPATEHLAAEVQRREDLRHLLRDMADLPDDQRAALVLAELGDVSHEEIAEVLGCAREKVKALVFQARSSLNASRAAREASCLDIREQLANLRGGSLRRNTLRRHLRECDGCREFAEQMRAQRRALALVLPVAPSLGLKEAVLGSVLGGSTAAGAGAGLVGGGASLAAKALVVAAVAGGGTTAGVVTLERSTRSADHPAPVAEPHRAGGQVGAADDAETETGTSEETAGGDERAGGDARPGGDETARGEARGRGNGLAHRKSKAKRDGEQKSGGADANGGGNGKANGHAEGGGNGRANAGGNGNANGHANVGGPKAGRNGTAKANGRADRGGPNRPLENRGTGGAKAKREPRSSGGATAKPHVKREPKPAGGERTIAPPAPPEATPAPPAAEAPAEEPVAPADKSAQPETKHAQS
jgi:RNA polymerase sigma factor (sigma-70 family)